MYGISKPKVSIILPTYNRAQYIFEAIESVQQQTYANWELLVVDDGSTDRTIQLFRETITDDRVILLETPCRLGITGSRNMGLKNATGDLIAFIDSDDLWDRSKLEKQINAFFEYPEAGYCLAGGYNFKKQGEPTQFFYKRSEGIRYGDLFLSFFKSEVTAATPSLVFKKDCLEKTGLFREEIFFADLEYILKLARLYKGIILYEPMVFRRIHESNISTTEWEKGYKEGIRIITSHKHLLPAAISRNALFRLYMNSGEKYLSYKERLKAIRQFMKAWRSRPFSILPIRKSSKAFLHLLKR